jgi:hypothetical protein
MTNKMRSPFGEADCESELKTMGGKSNYSELYFDETPFNNAAISPQTYLIVGRRGSGKTALAQYFSFQTAIRDPIYIDVDEPAAYHQVLSDIAAKASENREIAIPRLKKVWEYTLWSLVFEHTRHESRAIEQICSTRQPNNRASNFINTVFDSLLALLHEAEDKHIGEHMSLLLSDERLSDAKAEALKLARTRPIIIALDTLEKYDVSDKGLMNAMAALVQCAADFNLDFRDEGIHLKVFMSGEVFPYLKAEVIQNPLKSVKNPVYLFWRAKDLLRLISWRFFRYLKENKLLRSESTGPIDWTSHKEVRAKMWDPYFGHSVTNARGLREDTLSYVLRHTQMRPRQAILLCNSIAERAMESKRFPDLSESEIRTGVKNTENELAVEIINSFSSQYPQINKIVNGLMNMPMLFTGNELDKRAHETATNWPENYSAAKFRSMLSELGIVGRVSGRDDKGHIRAEFEYAMHDGLELTHRDECVIHPMFYSRFNVVFNSESRVIPISLYEGSKEDDNFP